MIFPFSVLTTIVENPSGEPLSPKLISASSASKSLHIKHPGDALISAKLIV